MNNKIYTIGYAGKTIELFIECLKINKIDCVIDVRSSPFSKTFPSFNKDKLKESLKKEEILYAHFGAEFGARRNEEEAYSSSCSLTGEKSIQVNFERVYSTELFQKGVERLNNALNQGYNVCLMCSEKHPLDCHRFWMIAYYFHQLNQGYSIINIVDENINQSFEDVINEVNIINEKNKFEKANGTTDMVFLFEEDLPTPLWVKSWKNFFNSNEPEISKKQYLMNVKIGYKKGDNEND